MMERAVNIRRTPPRVMVIDPDSSVSDMIVTLLARRGYRVISTYDPEEGLELFNSWEPDLCVIDAARNGAGGRTLCREIKAAGGAAAPVILMGAYVEDAADRRRMLKESGADRIIAKPLDSRDLVQEVGRLLESAGGKRFTRPAARPMALEAAAE